jgi:hypothetical protein
MRRKFFTYPFPNTEVDGKGKVNSSASIYGSVVAYHVKLNIG